MSEALLAAVGSFFIYFLISIVALLLFKYLYAAITPHDEWALIKDDQNTAAAIGLGGAIIGFAIALNGVISHSVSLVDFVVWAIIAMVAQVAAFGLVRFLLMPKIVSRIKDNEISAGIILASMSIAVGLINAACVSY